MNKRIWITACASLAALVFSAGAPAQSFWFPGSSTAANPSGKTGLFVVPSLNPTATPSFITTTAVTLLGASLTFSISSGQLAFYSPYALMYLAQGSDKKYHIYKLSLTGTGVPTPEQVSNLSLASSSDLCSNSFAYNDLGEPDSIVLLIEVPANPIGGSCSSPAFKVVTYNTPATSPPRPVPVNTTNMHPIYLTSVTPPGALGGVVMLDDTTGNLLWYANFNFESPTTLLTGVQSLEDSAVSSSGLGFAGLNGEFFGIQIGGGLDYLYLISAPSGKLVKEYTANGQLVFGGVADQSNFYFIDDNAFNTGIETFLQEPLAGGAVTTLYNYHVGSTSGESDSLVGSNGSLLVYASNLYESNSASLRTLPVGVTSTSSHLLRSFTGSLIAELYGTHTGPASRLIFANVIDYGVGTTSYSSESLSPSGTVKQLFTSDDYFLSRVSATSDSIFEVKGIVDTDGGYGGATLYGVNVGSGVATPFTTTGGVNFVVPNHSVIELVGALSSDIGGGGMQLTNGTGLRQGLIYNAASNTIYPISIANSHVTMY
jgi:hypothetical protein